MPKVTWDLARGAGGESTLTIHASPAPVSARIWTARTGYDVRLMPSVKEAGEIPTTGKDLIIVAAVDNVLHFRVFDGDGKVAVDTDERKLTKQSRQIDELRTRLVNLGPARELTESEKGQITAAVTSIAGLSPRSEHRDFRESRWESAPLKPGETITRYVPKVTSGHLALFGELEYKIDGVPYHLTTTFMEPAQDKP